MEIIVGEKIQNISNYFLGDECDFRFNTYIYSQKNKHKYFNNLNNENQIDNEKIIFCYGHNLEKLNKIINKFKNDFILITHNSDENIMENKSYVINMLKSEKLIKWYAQNVFFENEKLHFLPIGIANSMWEHGREFIRFYENNKNDIHKTNNIYFYFSIGTNKEKRQPCYNTFKDKIEWLNSIKPYDNFKRLSTYKYCICPAGNGIDSHRLWECFYLKCVPIVLSDPLINILSKNTSLPMIVLNSWDDLDLNDMPPYENFDFETSKKYLDLNYYKNLIETC